MDSVFGRPYESRSVRLTWWGDVTVTSPLTVRLAGDAADTVVTRYDSGYSPTVGDRVWLLRVGGSWMVGGKVV